MGLVHKSKSSNSKINFQVNMKVNVPEFYIAFVLADPAQPSADEYEKLRIATQKHLLERLAKTHSSISSLDLQLIATEYEGNKPEPRFHVFVEAKATICFSKVQPEPKDLYENLLTIFDRAYLLDAVRKIPSPFASAVEVQAQRLKRPTIGGAVKAPAFYLAFACSTSPTSNPSSQKQKLLLKLTHQEARKQLQEQYGEGFSELTMKIIKIEINEKAGKPEAKFNLYVEFEATATFSQNAPTPFELFQALSKVTNMSFISDVMAVGGPLGTLTMMVFRLCIFIEWPELVEVPDGDCCGDAPIVKVHIEFFVALVVRILGRMPSDDHLNLFDDCVSSFFTNVMKRAFGGSFVSMEITDRTPEFGKGAPLARFNMLHQYRATLQFHEPVPNEMSILSKVIQGNVGNLYTAIKALDSNVWNNTGEITMGRAVEKPPTDEAFGGKLEIDAGEKRVETPVHVSPPPPSPVESRTAPPPEKNPTPQKKFVVPKPPPRETAATPRKVIPKVESQTAPPPEKNPTPQKKFVLPKPPPRKTAVSVKCFEVFTAYQLRNEDMEPLEEEPLQEDYKALLSATSNFYTDHLKREYGSKFENLSVAFRHPIQWKANKPDPWYNVYIEWELEATFLVDTDDEAPSRWELTGSVVTAGCTKYLKEFVRPLANTPFARTTGVFTKQYAAETGQHV
jgi:hypothetical protein